MANTQLIEKVVAESAPKGVDDLAKHLEELEAQFYETAKAAAVLNNATANATGYKNITDAMAKSQVAADKVVISNNKVQQSYIQLSNAQQRQTAQQERQAAAAQKALSPYQQLSKELDNMRAKAKDVGVQFGTNSKQFKDASGPVQELDAKLKGIDDTLGQSQRHVGAYGNAFRGVLTQYIPFGEGTLKVGENLKLLGVDFEESASKLGVLESGFVAFSAAAFIAAIASAAYYLSLFKSTGNEVTKFVGGLKEQFANFGGNIIEGIKNFSGKSLLNLIPLVAAYNAGKGFKESFNKGVDDAAVKIDLVNADELDENNNRLLKADAERNRALAGNRKLDIADRQAYIKKAQEAENKILDNQKDNSDLYLANAILIGDKRNKLSDEQTSRLLKGDLKYAQELSQSGQQFSAEGFELYKKGIEKQIAAKEGAANQIVQLQSDADNMQLKADKTLAQAQERLDKARVASALDAAKTVLDSDTKGYADKVKANKNFVDASIALLNIQKKHELDAAGLSGKGGADSRTEAKNRQAIEVETQNAMVKIRNEGAANLRKIIKDNNDLYKNDAKERLDYQIGVEKQIEDNYVNSQNERIREIQLSQAQQELALAERYANGEISTKKYEDSLFDIENNSAQKRIQLQIDTLKKILEAQASALALGFGDPKAIQATGEKISNLINELLGLQTKAVLKHKKTSEQAFQELHDKEKQLADDTADFIKTTVDASYQNRIDAIKDIEKAVDDQASAEKDAANNSVLSAADKARKIALIDAQTAQKKRQLDQQAKDAARKQAIFDRAFAIAKIVEQTAIADIRAFADYQFPASLAIAAVISAIGAAQIATVLATPLPAHRMGTGNAPGGWSWVSEDGPELITHPDGKTYLSPDKPSIIDLPKGSKVLSHAETMRTIKPEKLHYAGGQQVPWNEILAQLKRNKPVEQKRPIVRVNVNNDPYYNKFYR